MRVIWRLALGLLLLLSALCAAVAINTWRSGSRQIEVALVKAIAPDTAGAVQRLQLLQILQAARTLDPGRQQRRADGAWLIAQGRSAGRAVAQAIWGRAAGRSQRLGRPAGRCL